jgi:Arm domain-containing DNA-binding protein
MLPSGSRVPVFGNNWNFRRHVHPPNLTSDPTKDAHMPLTDTRIRNAKPSSKSYKMAKCTGLYLGAIPTGAKLWRLHYRLSRIEKVLSIGDDRRIGLAEARAKRDEAKKLIRQGVPRCTTDRAPRVSVFASTGSYAAHARSVSLAAASPANNTASCKICCNVSNTN